MLIETVAALIWRFLGVVTIAFVLPVFVTLNLSGAMPIGAAMFPAFMMTLGAFLIFFSKPLGVFIAKGL